MLIAGTFSSSWPNMLITGLLSMVAAAQLQEFRQLNGGPFTSLMMTGNLRTLAESIYDGVAGHDKQAVTKGLTIGTIILSFVAGAGVTALLTLTWHGHTIWLSAVILVITLIVSHLERRTKKSGWLSAHRFF
ncbi:YoaK family protein [Secundilactobacillus silagei]|uniref:YoaK family protein n=1 Tax=Secundilactobacillus silagei TaxID=1293415 RepID=UPI000AC05422|nr:YoaK family protein [Secundilactobacillus silagei]